MNQFRSHKQARQLGSQPQVAPGHHRSVADGAGASFDGRFPEQLDGQFWRQFSWQLKQLSGRTDERVPFGTLPGTTKRVWLVREELAMWGRTSVSRRNQAHAYAGTVGEGEFLVTDIRPLRPDEMQALQTVAPATISTWDDTRLPDHFRGDYRQDYPDFVSTHAEMFALPNQLRSKEDFAALMDKDGHGSRLFLDFRVEHAGVECTVQVVGYNPRTRAQDGRLYYWMGYFGGDYRIPKHVAQVLGPDDRDNVAHKHVRALEPAEVQALHDAMVERRAHVEKKSAGRALEANIEVLRNDYGAISRGP